MATHPRTWPKTSAAREAEFILHGAPRQRGKTRRQKNREWPAFPVSATAPAEERKSEVNRNMTSWAVFAFGWRMPADAKSGKNSPEKAPHAYSQRFTREGGGKPAEGPLPKRISYSPFTTSILRAAGFSGSLRGISMLSTPSLWVAVILSVSTSSGRESTRRNEPYERSIR